MMNAGSLHPENTGLNCGSAWMYKDVLPKLGFEMIKEITSYNESDKWSDEEGQIGDICVIPGKNAGNKASEHGHIAILCDDKVWVSDFRQKHMMVYRSFPYGQVFRYTGERVVE